MEKERVTLGGKARGGIKSEVGKVTGMITNASTTNSLGKRCGAFGGLEMAAGKVEVLLMVGGLHMKKSAEA